MKEKIFFDSNIFIYAADNESLFYTESVGIIKDFVQTGLFTCDLCLLEFYQVITDGRKTPNPLSPQKAIIYIDKMWNTPEIDVLNAHILDTLSEQEHQGNLIRYNITKYNLYDYLIAACLKRNGISQIATFNVKDFKKYPWLTVVDPRDTYSSLRSSPRPLPSASCSLPTIPYGRQSITEQDVAAVCKVLRSGWLTQGPMVPKFEKAVSEYCGAKHAVAMNSGTSALHVGCLALGVGPGDLVWTSPITFVASANCARYCGADVDFVDIDPRTYNMSPDRLGEKLKQAKSIGRLPKVVIPVHLTGQPCDMEAIHSLSQEYGFRIIEDACHAIGGRYKGEPIGNCHYSDITIFSFHPVKTITSAEGGMAVTNDPGLAQTMALLRTHGISREQGAGREEQGERHRIGSGADTLPRAPRSELRAPSSTPSAYYYEQIALGFNYRMTDVQAALGLSQLTRLDEFVEKRHALAQRYDHLLADLPVTTPWQHPDTYSGRHLYVIRLKLNEIEKTRDQVFENLRSAGIGVNLHYIPVYRQPDFARHCSVPRACPVEFTGRDSAVHPGVSADVSAADSTGAPCSEPPAPCFEAERYYAEAITLPLFPALSEADQDRVVRVLGECVRAPN